MRLTLGQFGSSVSTGTFGKEDRSTRCDPCLCRATSYSMEGFVEDILVIMRLLREIHAQHLAEVGGWHAELILANDTAWYELLANHLEPVRTFADTAAVAYRRMDLPQCSSRCIVILNTLSRVTVAA